MDRRTLLTLLGATALAGCNPGREDGRGLNIIIAGAGIVGASIAFHLARSGAQVTVLDREGPASHASRGTFAWINATYAKQPRSYHALSQESLAGWAALPAELDLGIRWGGSLEWFDSPDSQARLTAQIAEQAEWGEDARMIAADELAVMEPNVDFGGTGLAAWSGNDGAIDPVRATEALLAAAQAHGARLIYPCDLTDVTLSGGRLTGVETTQGPMPADRLVLATGAARHAGRRFAGLDIPQRSTPGIIAITAPLPPLINSIIVGPGIHMHQRSDGRIVLGEQEGPPENRDHARRLRRRPNTYPDPAIAQEHAARMLAVAELFLPAIAGAEIEHVYIGWRPLPLDGHPVIGASPVRPDVYFAVMHSGVTLAPIVGQLAAHELIRGRTIDRLDAYRPGRDFETVRRY